MNDADIQEILHTSCICILGHRGSGKSSHAAYLCSQVNDRPVYVLGHASPELVEEQGWSNCWRAEEMYRLQNCVVWIDEIQILIPTLDKRANDALAKLLSLARHRQITLIMSTSDSRFVTRGLESWVDCHVIRDCEASLLKNGSLAKRMIKKYTVCDPEEFRLENNEYLFYWRDRPDLDGLHENPLPAFFDDRWSRPFALKETATELRENSADVATEQRQKLIVPTRNGKVNV